MKNFLLGLIAVGVLVIAGVLVFQQFGGGEPVHSTRWESAHEEAETGAGYYCAQPGVVPGMTGLQDPAFKSCVKDETATRIEEWEQEHPDDIWE